MMGLKAANNGILVAMPRQGANDWMSMKSTKIMRSWSPQVIT